MDLQGRLIAQSPIYRGNARKTLFTRDQARSGEYHLISLPGEISGTAQALMDAFIGQSRNGRNKGLLNQAWTRLYGGDMPAGLISRVKCNLEEGRYPPDRFFDMRMGISLNEDRWAAEDNPNYKMETVFRNAVFDFEISVDDGTLNRDENRAKLYYLLEEMREGRFWFGAGKTKGLGNLRLEMDLSPIEPGDPPATREGINHLRLNLSFDAMNPVLVGWNWGKKDPETPDATDTWVDAEILSRRAHVQIKEMLKNRRIQENQWGNENQPPNGIDPGIWREFVSTHSNVRFQHMLNRQNLDKSIANDNNMIRFLEGYREHTQQELAREHHIDFRAGGPANRDVSRRYGKPYDKVFMRMLSWTAARQDPVQWEIYIPGSTIKGAFRKRAAQVLKTLMTDRNAENLLTFLFGAQGRIGKVLFSDAYLADPVDKDKAWCSVDGVRMNPQTALPYEGSKLDYLLAYGDRFRFNLRIDIRDIGTRDLNMLSVLWHMLRDLERGDIPLGGERSNGVGWVKAEQTHLTWLTSNHDDVTRALFPGQSPTLAGIWHRIDLEGDETIKSWLPSSKIQSEKGPNAPPRADAGFISHKAFGGKCGMFTVEAEVLTPLSIRESGGPSYITDMNGKTVNGWDFFSMSPPDPAHRAPERIYALPSKSIKGMLRHIYSIASDSRIESRNLGELNSADGLFGWVGTGSNQALAGRVSVSFGQFVSPELSWFEAPLFYGHLHYDGNEWKKVEKGNAKKTLVDKRWRIFPHAPLAPGVRQLERFEPHDPDLSYFRAVMPGSKARFTIRFWNLLDEELQRLVWCIMLASTLAHKMGNRRYLGFGSIRFKLKSPWFFVDWAKRYSGSQEKDWQRQPRIELDPAVISHHDSLQQVLNADRI